MAITKITTYKDLACAATAGIIVDDIVTGQTSSAKGVVMKITTNSKITVAVISGTFQAENVDNQDADRVAISAVANSTETMPNSVVIVEGDYSATTDIFQTVRDNMSAAGYTDPSGTNYYLQLQCTIFIGRRDQASETKALSTLEMVDMTADANTTLRIIGNSSYASTLRLGIAKYKDNNESNFPPLYCYNGTKIKMKTTYIDTYGVLKSYSSDFLAGGFQSYGSVYFERTNFTGTSYMSPYSGAVNKYNDCRWNLADGFIPDSVLSFTGGCRMNDIVNWGIFVWSVNTEQRIYDVVAYDNNGVVSAKFFGGGWYAVHGVHLVNSDAVAAITTIYGDTPFYTNENTFQVILHDYDNNPIVGAKVQLLDKTGNNILCKNNTNLNLAAGNTYTSSLTSLPVVSVASLSINDYIRIGDEFEKITNIVGNTLTVTRAQLGTTARKAWVLNGFVYKRENGTTDSDGETDTYDVLRYFAMYNETASDKNPFTLVISADGFETYTHKFTMSGLGHYEFNLKLKNAISQGRDNMATAFK